MTLARASSFDSFIQLLGVLLIFIFVLGITYVATRWIAGYQKAHSFNQNLRIIETLRLTPNKYEVRLLTKLTREQLKELPSGELPDDIMTESFKEIFDKIKKHIPKK